MDRLVAREERITDVGFTGGFVATTAIDDWVAFLGSFLPIADPTQPLPLLQRRNLGYRLQLMEFDCALLLLDRESRGPGPFNSTLHSSVSSMKIHQFCVLAHGILEGIGAHLWRVDRRVAGLPVNPANKVSPHIWRPILVNEVLNHPAAPAMTVAVLSGQLEDIKQWRDRVHLDIFDPAEGSHFNDFTYPAAFVPTYRTFRAALTALAANWPATCLNEAL
jgi:hypothetical protein